MTMSVIRILLGSVFAHLLMYGAVNGHPQCLDYAAPFEPKEALSFCTQYTDFACCTKQRDTALKQRYARILQQSYNDGSFNIDECKDNLKEILCQECSPYAVHVFDAERDHVVNPFPGLCNQYCTQFYTKCKNLVPYITDDQHVVQSLETADQFCSEISIGDPEYCYPDWNQNPLLVEEISRETRTEDGCLCLEPFAENLRNALSFRVPPDDTERIFISEQIGLVHIFFRNKTRLDEPFMNLSHMVLSSSGPGDERGFFNIAFHPNFTSNDKFYVYFSIRTDSSHWTRLSEFRVSSRNENKVNPDSERVIIEIQQPYDNHNGGELLFGMDGYLYLFLGDGGSGGDPHGHGQNKSSLLGSVLRLDIDQTTGSLAYGIPPDNPFVHEANSRPEIYAYGVRNVWRCDMDEGDPATGDGRGRIFCGDVGQARFEEIDIMQKGGNFGWNAREGFECYRTDLCSSVGPLIDPIYAYDHVVGKSVTGGSVYRGCNSPNLQGQYIYGDYVVGRMFALTEGTDGAWTNRELSMCGDDICINGLTNQYERNILSFGEDQDGEVFVLTTSFSSSVSNSGKVYKLVDPRRRADPQTCRSYREDSGAPTDPTTAPRPNDDFCEPNPCMNGGRCSSAEDPFGTGYNCYCGQDGIYGGRHCQVQYPCKAVGPLGCPPATKHCHTSMTNDAGRFCYSSTWQLLDPLE